MSLNKKNFKRASWTGLNMNQVIIFFTRKLITWPVSKIESDSKDMRSVPKLENQIACLVNQTVILFSITLQRTFETGFWVILIGTDFEFWTMWFRLFYRNICLQVYNFNQMVCSHFRVNLKSPFRPIQDFFRILNSSHSYTVLFTGHARHFK